MSEDPCTERESTTSAGGDNLEMAITHPVVSTIVRYLNHFRVTIQEHLCAPHRLGRDQWGDTTFDANPMLQIIDDLGDVGPTILPEQGLVVWAQTVHLFLPQHAVMRWGGGGGGGRGR
jgi:hypothetical protein